MNCDCKDDEMCIVCHHEKKVCCHHLPIGEHCRTCDDDEKGDQKYHEWIEAEGWQLKEDK